MQIITSAAYVSGDLKSELGSIPPSFLPLKNNRLFSHQFTFLKKSDDSIYLTIPDSFEIDQYDNNLIEEAGIRLIRIPDNLSLSNSILYAVNSIDQPGEEVLILHGDTLFNDYPARPDTVYIAYTKDNYNWGNVGLDANNDKSEVYAGLFYFSDQSLLKASVENYSNDFVAAVESYAADKPLELTFINNWLDFGHANTYFRSKATMTTERVFNNLSINQYTVKKYSEDKIKMQAEANWFLSVPPRLKKYTPNFITSYSGETEGYELDYLYLNSLSELFVFGQNDAFVWRNIFRSCEVFIEDCLLLPAELEPSGFQKKYREDLLDKTMERLNIFSVQTGVSINSSWHFNGQPVPPLSDIADQTGRYISDQCIAGYVHGDFCFSNILFDFRKQMVRVIDPRGIDFKKEITLFGDLRYDIAKLSHSVIGLYDYILAGRFSLVVNLEDADIRMDIYTNNKVKAIQDEFLCREFAGNRIDTKENFALMIHLFLSMLPLHHDNTQRQYALMANALRLYQNFQKL
jgi:hypothetical protein